MSFLSQSSPFLPLPHRIFSQNQVLVARNCLQYMGMADVGRKNGICFIRSTKFFTGRMDQYSPEVFQTSLGEKMAIFCGAQGNKLLSAMTTNLSPHGGHNQ
ncbi:unnamed protein product [Fraxinus pennsylvanica]|uniref:Uncharacterized protein n=1 Tax=Fraxinus pennsylvanica TaxID=56036 RepID=A0AAD2AEC4_9LAMI|nr:unnamed protein product [Fraxinus pennsylvanica]